jgi:hypothetical protein
MNFMKKPPRLRLVAIYVLIASGLAVVLCETYGGSYFPRNFFLTLRTVFWLSVIVYLWLRLSKKNT